MCILFASVVGFPIYIQSLHILYDTLVCILYVYKATVWLVASCSLDIWIFGYTGCDTLVGTIHFICLCKSLLPHYQATLIFVNNICSTLACVYMYDGM